MKKVQIDGRVYNLLANVRKKPDGEYIYSIQLNEDKTKSASPIAAFAKGEPALRSGEADTDIIDQTERDVNPKFSLAEAEGPREEFSMEDEGETPAAYNRTAVLEEETVDWYLEYYTARSTPNYAQAYIAYMSPEDFLKLTTSREGRGVVEGQSKPHTFLDEYSRFRYLEAFQEHSTYSSAEFIQHCVKKFPFAIECVQTDNGSEFTNRLISGQAARPTLFEETLERLGIRHKLIRPYTPRHNGKVERSHRKDNEYFYASHKFFSFLDFQKQLAVRQRQYNAFPIRPLYWRSPYQALSDFVTHH